LKGDFILRARMRFIGEGVERLLREFIEEYYHVARPHQGLKNLRFFAKIEGNQIHLSVDLYSSR